MPDVEGAVRLPLRQTTGPAASLLKFAGLDWAVPDFSTLSRRQKGLTFAIPFRPGTGTLHLLIDSTGIKTECEGECFAKKRGPSKPRQWRKVPLGIDADTLEIRAIEVTGSRVGPSRGLKTNHCRAMEAPMLPELLNQIPADQPIGEVSADGAYDTRGCHAAIPARKNARPWVETTLGAQARNEILRSTGRLGRTIWRKWSSYHRRSLVETKMRCFKLLGERVMACDFDRQVAELQTRAAILNRFTALKTPKTQRVG